MNLFYEESGNFKASKILFRQGEAYFVENSLKEKIKVRSRDVLLEFNSSSCLSILICFSSCSLNLPSANRINVISSYLFIVLRSPPFSSNN